jgi:hypothetical protein
MGLFVAFARGSDLAVRPASPGDDKMSAMGKRARRGGGAVQLDNAAHRRVGAPKATTMKRAASTSRNAAERRKATRRQFRAGRRSLVAVDKWSACGHRLQRHARLDKNPISVSGFLYSEDGGKTFVDGGQLPSPGNQAIGTTLFPQVFGDPEVKYLGNCVFVYSSIVIQKAGAETDVQTMGVHRSTDCGKTWAGPFEVTSATNPNGIVIDDVPQDAADKEFMDVDPDTGRVLLSWSNFTPVALGGVEIRTTYSDNLKTAATPTWSPGVVVAATEADGQASIPRFASHSNRAYVAGGASRSRARSWLRQFRGAGALDGQWSLVGADQRPPSSSPWTRFSATIA